FLRTGADQRQTEAGVQEPIIIIKVGIRLIKPVQFERVDVAVNHAHKRAVERTGPESSPDHKALLAMTLVAPVVQCPILAFGCQWIDDAMAVQQTEAAESPMAIVRVDRDTASGRFPCKRLTAEGQ